jgi:hypothetical protein
MRTCINKSRMLLMISSIFTNYRIRGILQMHPILIHAQL